MPNEEYASDGLYRAVREGKSVCCARRSRKKLKEADEGRIRHAE